jgi:hypothetical protein
VSARRISRIRGENDKSSRYGKYRKRMKREEQSKK